MQKTVRMIVMALVFTQAGCTHKTIEYPGAVPGGYYNAYTNCNAVILYKRPSNKFGCWQAPCGWECRRR